MIEDTNSAEIVSDPYRRTQQDKEMDKAHFLLDLKTRTLIRNSRTHIILRQSTRGHFRSRKRNAEGVLIGFKSEIARPIQTRGLRVQKRGAKSPFRSRTEYLELLIDLFQKLSLK